MEDMPFWLNPPMVLVIRLKDLSRERSEEADYSILVIVFFVIRR
jgi:hypothetical protein